MLHENTLSMLQDVPSLLEERGKTYGSPDEFFAKFSGVLNAINQQDSSTPYSANILMIIFKVVRLCQQSPSSKGDIQKDELIRISDTLKDIIGYSTCLYNSLHKEEDVNYSTYPGWGYNEI